MRVQIDDQVGQDILDEQEIRELATSVLRGEGLPEDYEVSVSFVDEQEIRKLNREYRGIDRPTDVLSFVIDDPTDEDDEDEWDFPADPDEAYDPEDLDDPDEADQDDEDESDHEFMSDTLEEFDPFEDLNDDLDDELDADNDDDDADEEDEEDDTGSSDNGEREAGQGALLGDVIICPQIVLDQAPGYGNSAADEMRLLLVHGCLHLMGYDHENPQEAEQMEALERTYLAPYSDVPAEQVNVGPTVNHAAEGSEAHPVRADQQSAEETL